jgi:tetratricopeptide (TPR) repeat protein
LRRTPSLWVLAIALVVAAAYAPTVGFGYAQDAGPAVAGNPVVARGNLVEIFTSDYWKDTVSPARTLYRPVTVASFALERAMLGRPSPALSHAINAVLHLATALLLAALARRLGLSLAASGGAALLFAAHPLLLQAVANIVGRADVLATGFALAALVAFSFALPEGGVSPPVRRVAAWGAGACVFASLGAKEVGLAVLPLLVLLDVLSSRRASTAWLARAGAYGPSAIALLAWLHLRTVAIGEFPGAQRIPTEDNLLVGLDGLARVATTLAMAARYATLLVVPVRSLPDYSGGMIEAESSMLAPRALAGALVLAGLAALVLRPLLARRRGSDLTPPARAAAFGAGLALVPYLLVGNLLVLNAAGFAERLVYFSAAGACLLLRVGLGRAARRLPQGVGRPALAGTLALLVVQVRRLAPMWRDNEALFAYTEREAPESLRAGLAIAGRLEAEGRFDDALARYEQVTVTSPDYGGAYMARGLILARRGELGAAEKALRRSVELRPDVGEARMNLGLVLVLEGQKAEAERELRKALLRDPSLVKAAAQLAHLMFESGRFGEAARYYEGCVRLGRDDLRAQLAAARARAAAAPP